MMIIVLAAGCAQFPIKADPSVKSIQVGIEPRTKIELSALTDKKELQWELKGPGELEGNPKKSKIYYVPPKSIGKASSEAQISLTIKESDTDTKTYQIWIELYEQGADKVTAAPAAEPEDKEYMAVKKEFDTYREEANDLTSDSFQKSEVIKKIIKVSDKSYENSVFKTSERQKNKYYQLYDSILSYLLPNLSEQLDIAVKKYDKDKKNSDAVIFWLEEHLKIYNRFLNPDSKTTQIKKHLSQEIYKYMKKIK